MPVTKHSRYIPLFAALSSLVGCSEVVTQPEAYEIHFSAHVAGEPFACGKSYSGVGQSKAYMTPQNFGFYVSNIRLLNDEGEETPLRLKNDGLWQTDQVALLDFEDATGACNGTTAVNSSLRGNAPQGSYSGLRFTLGVPETLNHQDATLADPPLNYTGYYWGWRIGYIFFRLDMETSHVFGTEPDNHATGFSVHLGSVGCGDGDDFALPPESPCTTPNRAEVTVEGIDLSVDRVGVDLAALLEGTDITVNTPNTASGCMSFLGDPECFPLLSKFGLPYGGPAQPAQKVFGVR